jgi:hypothetical protein
MIPNCDITIYNKYLASRAEVFQRSVIRNVGWQATKAVSGTKAGPLQSNVATIFIPFVGNTEYLAPKAWQALVSKSANWTLQEGDVVVRGEVADEITGAFTITDLRAKYDDVVSITSVDTMDFGSSYMHHWEVGCK